MRASTLRPAMPLLLPDPWDQDPNLRATGWPRAVKLSPWHLAAWACYLGLLAASWKLFAAYRPVGDITIVFGVLALGAWLGSVWVWETCVYAWLDGARRRAALRGLLLVTAVASTVLPLLLLPLMARLLAGGVAALWVAPGPFTLFSAGTFLANTGMGLVAVLGLGLHAWLCGLLAWRLLWRVPGPPPVPARPPPPPEPAPAVPARESSAPPPVSRWHRDRPAVLSTAGRRDGGTVLGDFRFFPLRAYKAGTASQADALARLRRGRDLLDWPAFEWVLRTRPGWQEERDALLALPNLAGVVDEADAAAIRDWLERSTRDAREFVVTASHREDDSPEARTQVLRMADFGRSALQLWDEERARAAANPPG